MKIEKLKPGMVVYDVHSYTMGNTTMRSMGCWGVEIVSVDLERQVVVAKWNMNPEQTYYRNSWRKWRLKKPVMVKSGFGHRPANRAQLAAMKAKSDAGEGKGE